MAVTTRYDLSAAIRERLIDDASPDPHEIAARMVDDIPEEALRLALAELLPDRVREIARSQRRIAIELDPDEDGGDGRTVSAKWDRAARVFASRVNVDGEWKRLGECSRDDLLSLAADYDRRAAENASWADRYRAVARLVQRAKAARVSDLPVEKVLGALHG